MMGRWLLGVLVLCLAMVPAVASNIGVLTGGSYDDKSTAKDSYGRDTPRSTVQGFMQALIDKDVELASKYLDDNFIKKKNAKTVLANLNTALDKGGLLEPILDISDEPAGDLVDRLPSNQEKVGVIEFDDKHIDLILVRKMGKEDIGYWQLSEKTLSQIPSTNPEQSLSEMMSLELLKGKTIFGHDLADVVVLLILLVIWLLSIWLPLLCLYVVVAFIYQKVRKKPLGVPVKLVLPFSFVIMASVLPEVLVETGLPVTLRSDVTRIKDVLAWSAMAWLGWRLADSVFRRAEAASLRRARPEQVSVLNLLRKVAKVAILLLALIAILGNLGFDLTAGIAALGVGGLALAFGAQKPLKILSARW